MTQSAVINYQIRQAIIWLREAGFRTASSVRTDETGGLFIPCSFLYGSDIVFFRFPINKLGRRYIRELQRHLLKGIMCGTIKEDDVHLLFLGLSTQRNIYKYRTQLRRVTGLMKDKKLRKWLIWRRIKATEYYKANPFVRSRG